MSKNALQEWLALTDETKRNIFRETANAFNVPISAIEKDWWVVYTLALVFKTDCASSLIFKGGTSLSKGWNLIQRFSEDIDLVLDREFLGFKGDLSKGDIRRMRKKSFEFITSSLIDQLTSLFRENEFTDVSVTFEKVANHDQDPVIIEILYPKLIRSSDYLHPGVQIEVGCRSLKEPFSPRTFGTFISETFSGRPFADRPITIPVVNPERTFLEKIFLLHEEFQKEPDKIRVERLSRHLYDIEKLMHSTYAEVALADKELYQTIVNHRRRYTAISGVDYSSHDPANIMFIPPVRLQPDWQKDYELMTYNMLYGERLGFHEIIRRLTLLQSRINSIVH
jgi:hypothetical protein